MDNDTIQRLLTLAGLLDQDDIQTQDVEVFQTSSNDDDDIIEPCVSYDNTFDVKNEIINAIKSAIPEDILCNLDINIEITDYSVDENAEFDYRTNPAKPNGEKGEIDAYRTLGQAKLNVRYTPAKMADNPLTGKTFQDYYDEIKTEK